MYLGETGIHYISGLIYLYVTNKKNKYTYGVISSSGNDQNKKFLISTWYAVNNEQFNDLL